jgi:transketolase
MVGKCYAVEAAVYMKMCGRDIRRIVLEQSYRAHVGHIGSALAVADLVAVLYGGVLNVAEPGTPDRDRFVLSKGHAALALYAALHLRGWISKGELDGYCGDGTLLGVHPECQLTGVDFASGSLGQGLCFGGGAALAGRMQRSRRRVFVLMSDAELNEGSVWEAVMFAAHHRLGNLIVIVDNNGQQALGYTRQVLNVSPIADRWRAFGWDVHEVGGHDPGGLTATLRGLDTESGSPHILVANTVFGKGVSFMEGQIKWHYWPLSEKEFRLAIQEVEAE